MKKGVSIPIMVLLAALSVITLEGIYLFATVSNSENIRRSIIERGITAEINRLEFLKMSLHQSLRYSFYQSMYEVAELGLYSYPTEYPRESLEELSPVPSVGPRYESLPYWRVYENMYYPVVNKELEAWTSYFFAVYNIELKTELGDKSSISIPPIYDVEVDTSDKDSILVDAVPSKISISKKLRLEREKLVIEDSANIHENISTIFIQLFDTGRENFVETVVDKDGIKTAVDKDSIKTAIETAIIKTGLRPMGVKTKCILAATYPIGCPTGEEVFYEANKIPIKIIDHFTTILDEEYSKAMTAAIERAKGTLPLTENFPDIFTNELLEGDFKNLEDLMAGFKLDEIFDNEKTKDFINTLTKEEIFKLTDTVINNRMGELVDKQKSELQNFVKSGLETKGLEDFKEIMSEGIAELDIKTSKKELNRIAADFEAEVPKAMTAAIERAKGTLPLTENFVNSLLQEGKDLKKLDLTDTMAGFKLDEIFDNEKITDYFITILDKERLEAIKNTAESVKDFFDMDENVANSLIDGLNQIPLMSLNPMISNAEDIGNNVMTTLGVSKIFDILPSSSGAGNAVEDAKKLIKVKIQGELNNLEKTLTTSDIEVKLEDRKVESDIKMVCIPVLGTCCDPLDPLCIEKLCTTICDFCYYGAARVLVDITDKTSTYAVYDEGSTNLRNIKLKFYVVSGGTVPDPLFPGCPDIELIEP